MPGSFALITFLFVDQIFQRAAVKIIVQIFDEHVDIFIKRVWKRQVSRNMRCDQKIFGLPEPAVGGQRFGLEYVECRSGEMPAFQ